jgi:3-oxoacyl-[acyl-carrier-protein] synthase-3
MIVIRSIGSYIPVGRVSNVARLAEFGIDERFLREKIGAAEVSRRAHDEDTSDLGVRAIEDLVARTGLDSQDIDCLVVCTQNPDGRGLPHVSPLVHSRINGRSSCATFDLSLGCSGFVYGLSVVSAFMQQNGFLRGVLVTADPYSKIIDDSDKNTALLFGDAACATLLELTDEGEGCFAASNFVFHTDGKQGDALVNTDGRLDMNGRAVFSFSATVVPRLLSETIGSAGIGVDDIDAFVFHQGSKYIVDTIVQRASLPPEKVPIGIGRCGNAVSSSIPLLLSEIIARKDVNTIAVCGFGVGLSAAACILRRE